MRRLKVEMDGVLQPLAEVLPFLDSEIDEDEHLSLLLNALDPIVHKLEHFAPQIGVKQGDLRRITKDYPGDTTVQFKEMLANRLNQDKPLTMQHIVDALKAPVMKQSRMAKLIKEYYLKRSHQGDICRTNSPSSSTTTNLGAASLPQTEPGIDLNKKTDKKTTHDGARAFHGCETIGESHISSDDGQSKDCTIVYRRNRSGKPRQGLALIISNTLYNNPDNNRPEAVYDKKRLIATLKSLHYDVIVEENQSASKIQCIFDEISSGDTRSEVKEDDDSFICCISSHGGWDESRQMSYIFCVDGIPLYLEKMAYNKLSADSCPRLKGKPKMFFIQACRGKEPGRITSDQFTSDSAIERLPLQADFLFSYATGPETKAWKLGRSRVVTIDQANLEETETHGGHEYKYGSFYITELCDVIKNYKSRFDLYSIVSTVHYRLQTLDKYVIKDDEKKIECRMCPHITASLRGPVFFTDDSEKAFADYISEKDGKRCTIQ